MVVVEIRTTWSVHEVLLACCAPVPTWPANDWDDTSAEDVERRGRMQVGERVGRQGDWQSYTGRDGARATVIKPV